MLRLLALEIPSSFLWNRQIVFISAFNHFSPLPIVTLSLSLDSYAYTSSPPLFPLSWHFFFSLLQGEGKDKGGRGKRMGLKMQIQVFGSSLWQIRPHYSPISPLQLAGRSALSFSALLVFITLWYLSPLVNPPLFPGPVRRGEQPGDQREICGCRACDLLCRWSRTEMGRCRHHFYVCGQTALHFFAFALCQQPTPLSLSALWELLPPSQLLPTIAKD